MTPEQAEKINEAIEFFPGRILRDDWVGQAQAMINDN
jgi:predicted flap endonuclease-1-like 5' DNA nuclease